MLQHHRFICAGDFAPGDRAKSPAFPDGAKLHRIVTPDDPWFDCAYDLLWRQFSPANEMEQRDVILRRLLARRSLVLLDGFTMLYEMVLVRKNEEPIAVRDHTVILPPEDNCLAAVVHLSHNLVLPRWRRSGIGAWMRAFPAASARELCTSARRSGIVVLAAEMEPMNPEDPERTTRLAAYEAAGFVKVEPRQLTFWQPDFRDELTIARTGLQPVPLHLILRICGAEHSSDITGAMLRMVISALYRMYERELSRQNVSEARRRTGSPEDDARFALVPPTSVS